MDQWLLSLGLLLVTVILAAAQETCQLREIAETTPKHFVRCGDGPRQEISATTAALVTNIGNPAFLDLCPPGTQRVDRATKQAVTCDGIELSITREAYLARVVDLKPRNLCPAEARPASIVIGVRQYNTASGSPEHCDLFRSPNTTDGGDYILNLEGIGELELRLEDFQRLVSGRLTLLRAVPGLTIIDGLVTIIDAGSIPVP